MNECSLHHKKCWAVKLTKNIVSVFMTIFTSSPSSSPSPSTLPPPLPPHLPHHLTLKHKLYELYILCKLPDFQKLISCFDVLCLILFCVAMFLTTNVGRGFSASVFLWKGENQISLYLSSLTRARHFICNTLTTSSLTQVSCYLSLSDCLPYLVT